MCFSRFESFSVAPSIPTVWIVENTQQPNSFLRSQRGIDFPPGSSRTNLRSKSSGLKCTEHITERFDGCHCLRSLLFDKTYPFLPSPLCFRTIVLEKWNLVQRCTLNVVFLVAATSSNTNRRHFLRTQSRDTVKYVDFTEIAGNRFWY